ncbi:MAG: hypothetical protein GX604_06030 [Actinobacteria bacterium]|nr:hypothetical protein [Actinomycetota bacterium]
MDETPVSAVEILPLGRPQMVPPALRSLSCPNCAGSLAAQDGERRLECLRCGSAFLLPQPPGVPRRYFPVRVERLRAAGLAKKWLQENPDTPPDIDSAVVVDAHLLYVPIWEAKAYVVGWEFGRKFRARQELVRQGDDEYIVIKMIEEGVQEGLFTERRFYRAATDLAALGIGRPQVSGRDFALPYSAGELEEGAAVLDNNDDCELVMADARRAFLRPPMGTAGSVKLFLLREAIVLLYYPFWFLQYTYRGRRYEITIDGRYGTVHSARAPADNRRGIVVLLGSYVALAAALGVVVWVWAGWENAREIVVYVGAVIVALTVGVYWRFRLIREVEYHAPFSH